LTVSGPSPSVLESVRSLEFSSGEALANSNQGEVRRVRLGAQTLVVKQVKGRGLRRWLSRRGLEREHRAYRRLRGMDGFAHCHGLVDGQRLVLDFIEGEPFRTAELDDRERFFERLLRIIQAMHARGVAHGDLKRKANLLVDSDQFPVILDLGTALVLDRTPSGVQRKLFEWLRQTDLNAWVKLKYDGYEGVTARDQALLRQTLPERVARYFRRRA